MYYISFAMLYAILGLAFITLVKKPVKEESKKFNDVLIAEAVKGLTKSDVKYRKKRVKVLPLYQRFLYWCWFTTIIVLLVGFPILFCIARWLIIGNFVVPTDAVYYELGGLSTLIFGFGGFFLGIPLLVAYSYATNRGVIRKADRLYQLGSFQEYPKKANIFISGICGLIGLLIMFLPCNSYRYCTDDVITVKSAISLQEKTYSYSDIAYVENNIYDGKEKPQQDYTFFTTDGRHFLFGEDIYDDRMNEILKEEGIEIRIVS